MITRQKIIVSAALVVMAAAEIFAVRQAADVRAQRQQQAVLTARIEELQQARDAATNRLAALAGKMTPTTTGNDEELLKLRSEVTQWQATTNVENDPVYFKARLWMAKEEKIRQMFAEHPDQAIPEMKFLREEEWLEAARNSEVDTTDDMRVALVNVRTTATSDFGGKLASALALYEAKNNQQLPGSVMDLKDYIHPAVADVDSILPRYRILTSEEQANPMSQGAAIILSTTVDSIDIMPLIGPHTVNCTDASLFPPTTPAGKGDPGQLQPDQPAK